MHLLRPALRHQVQLELAGLDARASEGRQAGRHHREPEQIKAFRDTWKDGIHSYLTYLRDRLTVMRDLLTESGSIFVQIGDENVHRVRALMDEVFGARELRQLRYMYRNDWRQQSGTTFLAGITDYILWYAKDTAIGEVSPALSSKRSLGGGAQTTRY